MKPKLFLPVLLIVFLAGSAIANGQDQNEKKIERLKRKIEKQTQKLQELTGGEAHFYMKTTPAIKAEEIEKIKKEALAQAKEAREQVRESMEAQREAMQDQKREMEEKMIIMRKKNAFAFGGSGDIKVTVPELKGGVYSIWSGDQDNLSINKELTDESSSADFYYGVKEGAEGMNLHVNGSMEAGKVTIVIKKPDGELFNEYTLSPLANVNWNQNISFGDDEADKYTGKWTVTVTADKAKGKYSVVIRERN